QPGAPCLLVPAHPRVGRAVALVFEPPVASGLVLVRLVAALEAEVLVGDVEGAGPADVRRGGRRRVSVVPSRILEPALALPHVAGGGDVTAGPQVVVP